jgi:hypothetical protein
MCELHLSVDFYLASTEGYSLESPRRCWRVKSLKTNKGTDLLLIRIAPPLLRRNLPLAEVFVAARHVGYSVASIKEWPFYVHVATRRDSETQACDVDGEVIPNADLTIIAWGELYATEAEALTAVKRLRT